MASRPAWTHLPTTALYTRSMIQNQLSEPFQCCLIAFNEDERCAILLVGLNKAKV